MRWLQVVLLIGGLGACRDALEPIDNKDPVFETDTLPDDPGPATDSDGDGYSVDDDCDDTNAAINPGLDEVPYDGLDNDCDPATPDDDLDGDGYVLIDDCDDGLATVNPGALEICDGLDNDCVGGIDDGVGEAFYPDLDGDLFGDDDGAVVACSAPASYVDVAGDCDDERDDVYPGADEICDGADNDCNSLVDDDAVGEATWYADVDGDGFGDLLSTVSACAQPADHVSDSTDCDDTNEDVNPDRAETCNGIDDNCSGSIDEGAIDALPWYLDSDEDGYGDELIEVFACDQPAGHVSSDEDCDDTEAAFNPDADEICNGEDDDCDGDVDIGAFDAPDFYIDADGDAYGVGAPIRACTAPAGYAATLGDCDDGVASINPGATERCNGDDDDCDGSVDEDVPGADVWFRDLDDDGFGDSTVSQTACVQPAGYVASDTDCNDVIPTIYPLAPELCDGLDNDCDGQTDESVGAAATWYLDDDGDGFGTLATTVDACVAPAGYVGSHNDCDDANSSAFPGNTEFCDGYDNNCDGVTDESSAADATTWYLDFDSDGFGGGAFSSAACAAPAGFVGDATDCDDGRDTTHPGADELCDGQDNDCDGEVDEDATDPTTWYADVDGDRFGDGDVRLEACEAPAGFVADGTDCDDTRASVRPGGLETCNGRDDDCDTAVDEDAINPRDWYGDGDGDGFGVDTDVAQACAAPAGYVAEDGDCDDLVDTTYPGADEVCDGEDQDCDGEVDEDAVDALTFYVDADGDGFGSSRRRVACAQPPGTVPNSNDCDDVRASVNPSATEVCNTIDDDCNGAVDDGVSGQGTWYADTDNDGFGDPTSSSASCSQPPGFVADATDCDDTNSGIRPTAPELCNGIDDNCNGTLDDQAVDQATWWADADGDGYGTPTSSTLACAQPAGFADDRDDCDDTDGTVNPDGVEVCDGEDNDCSGTVDDFAADATFYHQDADGDGFGNPAIAVGACSAPPGFVANNTDCADTDATAFPGGAEVCDGRDNDCDGVADNGATGSFEWYADSDGDGFGDADDVLFSCAPPAGYVLDDRDCDDSEGDINPAADEICNAVDDDCDGRVDVAATDADTWWEDSDSDGYGDPDQRVVSCDGSGLVDNDEDCDDSTSDISPDAEEVCNGDDDDCDGSIDLGASDGSTWHRDGDEDGYGHPTRTLVACSEPAGYVDESTDCNDALSTVYPGADELCDGFDNDCNGQIDDGQVADATWYADADNDGFGDAAVSQSTCSQPAGFVLDSRDCNDAASDINPAAPELCNNVDDDCNGAVDDAATDAEPYYGDSDGDGVGAGRRVLACSAPAGFVEGAGDCDDDDGAVYPGADEVCDGDDEDCDGVADNDATDALTWYRDADADGFGNSDYVRLSCTQPTGFVEDGTDCFDADSSAHPGGAEVCDGRDNDCNGQVDDGASDIRTWYRDADADGFGDSTLSQTSCSQPAGYVTDARDCLDTDASVNPSAVETCDGTDEDCDGIADNDAIDRVLYYTDTDGDGVGGAVGGRACSVPTGAVGAGGDCDDTDPDDYPGAPETCDGEDDDCDGIVDGPNPVGADTWYLDVDGDGFAGANASVVACEAPSDRYALTATDCNDGAITAYPGADELCDGLDNDCDRAIDEDVTDPTDFYLDGDNDGYGGPIGAIQACVNPGGYIAVGGDCDDANAAISPGADERCNTIDDDCDGRTDEGDAVDARTWSRDADGDGYGNPDFQQQACSLPSGYVDNGLDCNDLAAAALPGGTEICDGLDNNCSGEVDESSATDAALWFRDGDGDGYGLTGTTQRSCARPSGYAAASGDCDDGAGAVNPAATELCNGIDDNCDSAVDEDAASDADLWFRDADGDTFGDEGSERSACSRPSGYVADATDCNDSTAAVRPTATEVCNAIDDDCTGLSDDNSAGCPHPLHWFGDSVYMYVLNELTWQNARDYCYSYGYDMLAIEGQAENFWSDGISDSYSDAKWWTGMNDIAQEGDWVWDNGQSVTYTNWHAGEPNNVGSTGEDCMQYNRYGDGTWNDEPCSSPFKFICEAPNNR